ncbi:MAG: bifunctional ornithine acetyltransferase/N-acetylglutamate synthase, partial [Desulfobacteraceae bacterium]|nr:bifunctional ornithine acetyltransferase/N-acetylglutamate synthase [Desulfobacteraceae bacterium]
MKILKGGLENIPGYTYSAVKAEIRYKDRYDYSLIVSDQLCNAAGAFTTNKIVAAPVKICRERIEHPIKAILINATNANACTADQGYKNALDLTSNIAEKLDTDSSSILMSSTGIIGHQLPADKMMNKHSELINTLTRENGRLIPTAIMTTDTVPKEISVSFTTTMGE